MSDAEISDGRDPVDAGAPSGARPAPATSAAAAYRVLARKYRPATFCDLIGQDAMVRTLSNAFETGRIPHAWMLTGVRGVGKTTTARIIARALNYERGDMQDGPTIHMPAPGIHCRAIMESRHVDVIEMDAASHNGVEDVRQINEAVRYAPVAARFKVYILDEVHMLSPAAFNALLKTLEEPPAHAKFIFATTEVRRVPVTVLSRCQRFDLRRVEVEVLAKHLAAISQKEGISAEPAALLLIARAAEGSVRDALSLLDQAIAHTGNAAGASTPIRAEDVRHMLGLADRVRVIDLFEMVMRGDIGSALRELRNQYDEGADPLVVLADLAELTHFVTRAKIVPSVTDDPTLPEVERARGRALAAALPIRVLSRAWQMLLRGIGEVQTAGNPLAAAEMVLVRIAYAADLPAPEEVIRSLGDGERLSARAPGNGAGTGSISRVPSTQLDALPHAPAVTTAPAAQAAPLRTVASFEDLIELATERRDLVVKTALERDVRLVRFEDGRLEIGLEPGTSSSVVNDLSRKLGEWTGRRWMVVVSAEPAAPTVRSRLAAQRSDLMDGVRADPLVQAVLARFPGAEILDVRRRIEEGMSTDPAVDSELTADDDPSFASRAPDNVDDDC